MRAQDRRELAVGAEQSTQLVSRLKQAHASDSGSIDQGVHPSLTQALTSHTKDLDVGYLPLERGHQIRAVHISGRLTGDEEHSWIWSAECGVEHQSAFYLHCN